MLKKIPMRKKLAEVMRMTMMIRPLRNEKWKGNRKK